MTPNNSTKNNCSTKYLIFIAKTKFFPPKIHPEYLKQPSAFILPHLGSATKKTRTAMADLAIDNIDEFFKTGSAKNKVN